MGGKTPGYGFPNKPGKDGNTPSFSIGAVTAIAAGQAPTASITGTSTNPVLNLGLTTGNTGTAPTLAIGTVTSLAAGATATASITGSGNAYQVNLGLPAGASGTTPTLSIGTVTSLAAGASATASIAGSGSSYQINLGLPAGANGATPALSIAATNTLAAGSNATASITAGGAITFGIPAGVAGSNAAATPLGTTTPKALGTAAAGTATNASREDHVHPATGTLLLVGTATVGETLLISLALGVKRYTATMAGLAVGDRVIAFLTGAPGASSLQDIYVSAANTYNVGLLNPALGVGAVIAVPIAIYKVAP